MTQLKISMTKFEYEIRIFRFKKIEKECILGRQKVMKTFHYKKIIHIELDLDRFVSARFLD